MSAVPPRIVVSGNCQTAGLAAALLRMTPAGEVHALPMGAQSVDVLRERLRELAPRTDLWFVSANNAVAREVVDELGPGRLQVVPVPIVDFAGFHPDLCYARNRRDGRLTAGHYNSAIVAWAHGQGLSVEDTVALFRREVFEALGYFDAWDQGVQWLRSAFARAQMESRFARFFLGVKREGCFMHSTNHPKIGVLVRLARLVSEQAGLPLVRDVHAGELNDGLNAVVWPVYPELADELGLEGGGYRWKFLSRGRFVDSLPEYVEQAFAAYEEQGIARGDLEIDGPSAVRVDEALRRITGRAAR